MSLEVLRKLQERFVIPSKVASFLLYSVHKKCLYGDSEKNTGPVKVALP